MDSRDNKFTERMGITRRNFIKLAAGGALGIALSPLPWKLTDDIAIWTQNLPWVPVPPVGELSYASSVCMLCPGGCGIKVRKVEDRAVKIEGRTDFPVNPGGICPLGMGGLQLLYSRNMRFTGPMKRLGTRGSGEFQSISWDEALDIAVQRISGLTEKGDIGALAAIDGSPRGSTMSVIIERFLKALGSPNYMRMPSSQDTDETASYLLTGNRGTLGYDLENADFILSFGSGLLDGWGAPGRVVNAWGLWRSEKLKERVHVVQVEPRASNTASRADKWIPVKPGTEAALALSIAHVIVKENLYDLDFVENYALGFFDFKSPDGIDHKGFKSLVLENYSPEKVEQITGLEANEIRLLARDFSSASAPLAVCGRGKGSIYGSIYESMAVLSLNALVGGINRAGGIFINEPVPLAALPEIEAGTLEVASPETDRIDRAGSSAYPFSRSLFNNLASSILNGDSSSVDTLLVFSSNPAFTIPDGGDFKKAMERIPFIISFSPYRDETSLMADLILPDHTYLEKMEDMACTVGLHYPLYSLSSPAVDQLYDTKNSGDAVIDLAKKIKGSAADAFPWTGYEEIVKARLMGIFDAREGLTSFDSASLSGEDTVESVSPDYSDFDEMWNRIKENGLWYKPYGTSSDTGAPFKTASGKFEFFSSIIESALKSTDPNVLGIKASGDESCMPHFEESSSEDKSFPLRMYPYELINLASGWIPNPPYLNKTLFDDQLKKDRSFADINPETAAEYGLRQGDSIFIESSKGRIPALVNMFEGAMPGIVFMPLGLGHSGYDDFLRNKGSNPNDIIYGERDALSGQTVWWNTPVRIIKA